MGDHKELKEQKIQESIPVRFEEDEDADIEIPEDGKDDLKVREDRKLKSKFMSLNAFQKIKSFKEFEVEAKGEKGLASNDEAYIPEKAVEDDDIDPDFIKKINHEHEHFKDFLYGAIISELGTCYSRQVSI